MLKIRLSRVWKKDTPMYRVVITEHSKPVKNGYMKVLGSYDGIKKTFKIIDIEALKKYISNGVQLSPRVEKLMKQNNISL